MQAFVDMFYQCDFLSSMETPLYKISYMIKWNDYFFILETEYKNNM